MNYFITNREIIKNGNIETIREDGSEHAGDNLRFGRYVNPNFELFPEPVKASEVSYNDLGSKNTEDLMGSSRLFKELYDELFKDSLNSEPNSDVLFFIHGFNTDLDGVRSSFERLDKLYVQNGNSPIKHLVIFTWPSKSPTIPLHYFDDKFDAMRSGEALARCFEKVMEFLRIFLKSEGNPNCKKKIHLMAHSMGHRVLKHMMLTLDKRYELFDQIVLLAADIEYSIFEHGEAFNSLLDMGSRVHIYFHEDDRVLDISKFTKNFSNRLGRYGRKRIDPTLKYVIDADVSDIKDDSQYDLEEKMLNHWYYYSSTEVVKDINSVLNGKDSIFKVET
jgi:esterase/lipase superfamily enzyme